MANRRKKDRGWRNKAMRKLREDYIIALKLLSIELYGESSYSNMDYTERLIESYRQEYKDK